MTIQTRVETLIEGRDAGATATLKKVEAGALAAKKANDLLHNALKGAVAFFAAKFSVGYVKEVVAAADSTSKLARSVGSTTEAVSRLRYVFDSVGLGAGRLDSVLNSFEKKRAQALRGLTESVHGFELLGVSLDDLRNLGVEDIFEKIATNLESVGDQTERQARLSVAFEDSFRGMEEVLGKGSAKFKALRDDAEKFSLVLSGRDGIVGEEFSQALTKVGGAFDKVFGRFLLTILPGITAGLEKLTNAIIKVGESLDLIEVKTEKAIRAYIVTAERELAVAQSGRPSNPFGSNLTGSGGARIVDKAAVIAAETELKRLRDLLVEVRDERNKLFNAPGGGLTGIPGGPPPGSFVGPQPNGPLGPAFGPEAQKLNADAEAEAARNATFKPPTVDDPTLQPGFIDGLTGSWNNLVQTMGTATAAGQQFGSLVGASIGGVTDILVDMIATGKSSSEAWKKFGASILAELAKIALQYAIIGAIKAAFGLNTPAKTLAHGGIMGGGGDDEPMRIHKFAHGGIARGRSVAIYGETSRAEAYVPLQDGRSLPVKIEGSGGSSVQNVYYISAMDSQSMAQALQGHGAIYRGAVRDGFAFNGGDRRSAKRAVR